MANLEHDQLKKLMLGKVLGEGSARKVFECRLDPTLVVKAELYGTDFQNVAEWEIWKWVKDDEDLSQWFAPCVEISTAGLYLVQKRVDPLSKSQLPERLPALLCDLKQENFGIYEGRVVCCDYGLVVSSILTAKRSLVKARWHHD